MTSAGQGDRRLGWARLLNARDLGGLPAGDGTTRFRAVVRSDGPARLEDAGRAAMLAYGVATIVDLRSETEVGQAPSPLRDVPGYRHRPFIDEAGLEVVSRNGVAADTYLWQLESQAARVGAIFNEIAGAPPGAVLVHCAAGKDRTGMVAAMLLGLAGVEAAVVAGDYALSGEALLPLLEDVLAAEPDADRQAFIRRMFACPPEAMLRLLADLDGRYGGVAGYLTAAGVGAEAQERLRRRLLG